MDIVWMKIKYDQISHELIESGRLNLKNPVILNSYVFFISFSEHNCHLIFIEKLNLIIVYCLNVIFNYVLKLLKTC